MQRFVTLEKRVGETPLDVIRAYKCAHPALKNVPMAYAGRLDPMASGTLLILIGDECKRQANYHKLDKAYRFEVLFGVGSDTGDVLGILKYGSDVPKVSEANLRHVARTLSGHTLTLPYPIFSSKTVHGKPLYIWTLENRLNEIEIPFATTRIHKLKFVTLKTATTQNIFETARAKIDSLPKVSGESKKLGADFRRTDVHTSWNEFKKQFPNAEFSVATFECICSSGTYMRSLATHIGIQCDTPALAFSIHRTRIGRYTSIFGGLGFWSKRY